MISFNDLVQIVSDTFFEGDFQMAGVGIYIVAILLTFTLTDGSGFKSLIVGMAVTMLFSMFGILSAELTILLIVVSVLGLAYTSRSVWRD